MQDSILPTCYAYNENKALSASMITHDPSEGFDTVDSDDMLPLDNIMVDDEVQLLYNRTTDIKLSVWGNINSGHLNPSSMTFPDSATDLL